jgi:hypothetical protein
MQGLSLRFVRWGAGLLVLGLLTGYGPLGHYLMGGVKVRCPWAPVHAHVVLLGWVAFTLFGLVYRALPEWGSPTATTVKLATVHFWLSVVSVLGVYANGTFGYRLLDRMSPRFYYRPGRGDTAVVAYHRWWIAHALRGRLHLFHLGALRHHQAAGAGGVTLWTSLLAPVASRRITAAGGSPRAHRCGSPGTRRPAVQRRASSRRPRSSPGGGRD